MLLFSESPVVEEPQDFCVRAFKEVKNAHAEEISVKKHTYSWGYYLLYNFIKSLNRQRSRYTHIYTQLSPGQHQHYLQQKLSHHPRSAQTEVLSFCRGAQSVIET